MNQRQPPSLIELTTRWNADTYADGPSDPAGTPDGTTGGHSNYSLNFTMLDAPQFREFWIETPKPDSDQAAVRVTEIDDRHAVALETLFAAAHEQHVSVSSDVGMM